MGASVIFSLTTIVGLCLVAGAALWPLKDCLRDVFHILVHEYSINSNLDVLVATILYIATIYTILIIACTRPNRVQGYRSLEKPSKRIQRISTTVATVFQLLLLTKAILTAILAPEQPWPDPHTPQNVGLIYMYISIVAALLASFIQDATAKRCIVRWEKQTQEARSRYSPQTTTASGSDDNEVTVPLLANGTTSSTSAAASKPATTAAGEKEDDDSTTEVKGATIGALLKMATPDTPILLLAFAAGGLAALGNGLIPYYTGHIIDYASIDPNRDAFVQTTIKLLIASFLTAIFTGIRGGLFTLSMARLNIRLRTKLFESLIHQDVGFFDATKTGEVTSRLAADTTTVSDQISLNINVMFRSATQAAVVLAFMFTASWRLTVVTFVIVPLVLAISKAYGRYYRKLSKKVQSELAEANSVAEEALGTMTTVKSHAAEGSCKAAYAVKLQKFYVLQKKVALLYSVYMTTNTFLSAAVVAGVLYYGGCLVLSGAMSAGSLVSFMLYQSSLSSSFQQLGDVFSALSAAVGAADKVIELISRQPTFRNEGTFVPPTFSGKLQLMDVSFAYPLRPHTTVLSGLNLVVQPGSVVALCGSSGGGKSSIVKLLERFYLPTAGRVLLDDRDVGCYEPGWLHRRVALVSQEPVLYARSVRRNILYGLEGSDGVPLHEIPTDEDVIEAAKLANAHDFITALPEGYETECGERGLQLSGGQKQRIAIARALVRRPSVLLLDEATSALDADSEHLVQSALDATMQGRTVLVIAHRLSTIQSADTIVVVKGGQVVEMGNHDELLRKDGGAYAALVSRQLARTPSSMAMVQSASAASLLN